MKSRKVTLEQIFELFEQMKRGRVTGRVIQETLDRASKTDCKVLFEDALDETRGDADVIGESRLRTNALCAIAVLSDRDADFEAARKAVREIEKQRVYDHHDVSHAQAEFVTALCASNSPALHEEAILLTPCIKIPEEQNRAWVACIKRRCSYKLSDAHRFVDFVGLPKFRFQALLAIAETTKDAGDIDAARRAARDIDVNEAFMRCNALISILALEGKRGDDALAVDDALGKVGKKFLPFVYNRLVKLGWDPGNDIRKARQAALNHFDPGFEGACALAAVTEASGEIGDLVKVRAELLNIPPKSKKERAEVLRLIANITKSPNDFEAAYIAAYAVEHSYERAFAFIRLCEVLKKNID